MTDLCVWNRCNNRCIMCSNPAVFQDGSDSYLYSFEKIIQRIQSSSKSWRQSRENINLTGGEPTIHPRFLELCYWLRKKFPENKLVLATNGRMFSYPSFARKFLMINNVVIETALLGFDQKSHESITRVKDSFIQAMEGIRNISKYRKEGQELEIRTILVKQNYKVTEKILDLVYNNFPSIERMIIIFPEPEGVCGKNFKTVGVTYSQVKEEIISVVKKQKDKFKDLRLYHFPLCTIPAKLWKYTWATQRREEIDYLPSCKECFYKDYCCGIHKDYLEIIGSQEFKPIKTKLKLKIGKNHQHPIEGIL